VWRFSFTVRQRECLRMLSATLLPGLRGVIKVLKFWNGRCGWQLPSFVFECLAHELSHCDAWCEEWHKLPGGQTVSWDRVVYFFLAVRAALSTGRMKHVDGNSNVIQGIDAQAV